MVKKTEIKRIISNWDVGNLLNVKQITRGLVNTNFIVKTSKGKFILRKQAKFKKLNDLKFELKYLKYLKDKGFSYNIPVPKKTKKNSLFLKINKSFFWLYPYIEGHLVKSFGKPELREVAKMMAEYHPLIEKSNLDNKSKASNLYQKEAIKELNKYKEQINKKQHKDKKDKIFLLEAEKLIPLMKSLDLRSYSKLSKYPIHRDINPENTLWKKGELVGIIDFENVAEIKDTFIKEISGMLQYSCRDKKYKYKTDVDLIRFFINEYKKHLRLSSFEISFIPIIITAGGIEDFTYSYWMLLNDPKRAKHYRLKLYSQVAQWHFKNKDKILKAIKK